jgi:hypothetical protein
MEGKLIRMEKDILAHWSYTYEEWKAFTRWNAQRRGLINYLFHRMTKWSRQTPPEIKIAHDRVHIGDESRLFHGEDRQLRRVNITDTGGMNMLEITYHAPVEGNYLSEEIHIPVPKGKLREAIDIQTKLHRHTS